MWYVIQPVFDFKLALMSTLSTVAIYSNAEGAAVSMYNITFLWSDGRCLPQRIIDLLAFLLW